MQNKRMNQPDFDIEQYMNERLLEVTEEQERKSLRNMMNSLFLPLSQYMEERYENIQQQMRKQEKKAGSYPIITGICPKDRLAAYEDTMFPILPSDVEDTCIRIQELEQALQEKQEYFCYRVYCGMDFLKSQEFYRQKRRFRGEIHTQDGAFEAYFVVKKSEEYEKSLKELYQVFLQNEAGWQTVFAPYIYKMADVYLVEASYPVGESVERIEIDFEEYKDDICYQMIPLWNLEEKRIRSSAYPSFQADQINYTHTIFASQLKEDSDYLIRDKDINYWGIRRVEGDLCVECKETEPVSWKLWELHQKIQCHDKVAEQLFCNRKDSKAGERVLRTKAEIAGFVRSLDCEKWLKLERISREESGQHLPLYDMNEFLKEEIYRGNPTESLVFSFSVADKENYLNYDLLSYVMSCIQWELPEYRCVGNIL